MTAAELKQRIVSAAMARHRARAALEAACGPGNKRQRERRKAYRVINAAERSLDEAAAALDKLSFEHDATINGLDDLQIRS